jgi:P-type conjugative transfer protein TrbJ
MRLPNTILLVALSLFCLDRVHAFVVLDPTNLIQNTATAINTAKELVIETEELKLQLKDMENYQGEIGQWANIQNVLLELSNKIAQGQALAYQMQDLDQQYKIRFPGYVAPDNYEYSYQRWTATTHDTLLNTMESAGMQVSHFQQEQEAINQLAHLSQTAKGRMQAVQVGNMLATQEISQLQALRQLVATQINAQNTYAAYQTQKDASLEASTASWIHATNTSFPGYGKGRRDRREEEE